jgi:hypothetical protein
MNEGVAFGLCIAAVFLFIFAVELLRGQLTKEIYANAATWGIFLILTAAGHVHTPDDPSILITVGAAMQLLAFAVWMAPQRNKAGGPRMPVEFGILMSLALAIRVSVTMVFDGYLPNDQTGDGCIQVLEGFTLLIMVYGLQREMRESDWTPKTVLTRVLASGAVCLFLSYFCFGDLDLNEINGLRADEEYAFTIYSELASWFFMLYWMYSEKREGVNSMFLLPSAIQAFSRAVYWYAAFSETAVLNPIRLQKYFNLVLVFVHGAIALICGGMIAFLTDVQVAPQLPLVQDVCPV